MIKKPDNLRPIESLHDMRYVLLFNDYYSHGRWRVGYRNKAGHWVGVNACGTEGTIRFEPEGWLPLPGDDEFGWPEL